MIIAIKEKDRVVVAFSNTDYWNGLAEQDYVDQENVAIKFTEKEKAFAFAKSDVRADTLVFDDDFLNLEITPKTIIKDVIPYIKKRLEEIGKPLDDDGNWKNALIICDDNHIYDIDPFFGFYEADDYACHGYMVETLKSVLDATKHLSAKERILKAVRFASNSFKENFFPITITDTKNKKFENIFEGGRADEHIDSV